VVEATAIDQLRAEVRISIENYGSSASHRRTSGERAQLDEALICFENLARKRILGIPDERKWKTFAEKRGRIFTAID
jgi:hypothetical protein